MKKKFTFLMALFALMLITLPGMVKGQSTTYTSNVTFPAVSSPLSTCTVVINNSNYDGIKIGTSGTKTGSFDITIPSGTTKLYVHAAAWNGKSSTLSVTTKASGVSITPNSAWSLTADSGISGNSTTYTLSTPANASTSYFKEYTLSGVNSNTTITIANGVERAVIWGVNYEIPSPDPSCEITPTSWAIGDVQAGSSTQTQEFTVTASNLQHGLSFSVDNHDYYWISNNVTGMATDETSKTIEVTFNPEIVGAMNDVLRISGDDFENDITVNLTANGLCNAPSNTLAYTTPVNLTLSGDEVEYTLNPTANTGNGGTITYAMKTNPGENGMVEGNVFTAVETGTYVVTATQAVNGTTCGGTFDITINVHGVDPVCTIAPDMWDFETVAVGESANKTFTVTTANLTGNITLAMDDDAFTVSPSTIQQNGSTEITITFTPSEAGNAEAYLTANGGGISNNELALVSGTGATPLTITFNAGTGSCTTPSMSGLAGSPITLPTASPSATCAEMGWTFAGWATEAVSETQTAPTLLTGSYTISATTTLYAVYKEGSDAFDNTATGSWKIYAYADDENYYATGSVSSNKLASTTNENQATEYTFEKPDGYGDGEYAIKTGSDYIAYSSSSNLANSSSPYKWTISSKSGGLWRVASQTSGRALLFSDDNDYHKFGGYQITNGNPNTNYYDVKIGGSTATYNSNPSCTPTCATPTIEPGTSFLTAATDVTISTTTTGATIYYTTDGTDPTTASNVYEGVINVSAITTIKAMAVKSGYDNSEIAVAAYFFNSQSAPYTVAQARAAIDANVGLTNVYATGTVSEIVEAYSSTYHNISYNISTDGLTTSDQLQAFRGKSYNGNNFTSENDIMVGDVVVVYGTLKKYGNTYEFDQDNQLVSLDRPTAEFTTTVSPANSGTVVAKDSENQTIASGTQIENGTQLTVTANAADNYRFSLWSVSGEGATITSTTANPTTFRIALADATVTATFVPTFNVTTSVSPENTGTVTASPNPAIEGETVALTITPVSGYALQSLSVYKTGDQSTTVEVTNNQFEMPPYGVTVAATFSAEYTVTYKANGGTGDDIPVKYGAGANVTVAANTFEAPEGKLFSKWTTQADGQGEEYLPEATITNIQDNIDLYAQWRDIVYHITYNVNGETSGPVNVNYGESIDELPTPSLAPLTFLGWSTTGATGPVNVTAPYEPTGTTENITLYAVFGSTGTDDLEITGTTEGIPTTYASDGTWTIDGKSFTHNQIMQETESGTKVIQFKKNSAGYMYNTTNFGKIKSIQITTVSGALTVKEGDKQNPSSASAITPTVNNNVYTYTFSGNNSYCYIINATSNAIRAYSIVINYEASVPVTVITGEETLTSLPATPVVVANGGVLTFTGTNTDNTKLIIEDGGQLILGNSNTNVKATVKKNVSTWTGTKDDLGWQTLSTTTHDDGKNFVSFDNVNNLVYLEGTPQTPKYNVYKYDEGNLKWINNLNDDLGFSQLDNGCGYIYRTKGTEALEFTGVVNTGNIDYTLSYACAQAGFTGFNLIGNPYTHSIYKGHVGSAIVNGTLLEARFCVYNPEQGTFTLTDDGTEILPMQAILVQALDQSELGNNYTLTIVNSKDYVPVPVNNEKYANDNIWFTVKNAEYSDVACVDFKEGHGFNKPEHRNDQAPMLYIMNNGERFASACMPDNTSVINLGFEAKTMGEYTISLKAEGQYSYMHLIDKLTGEDIDMLVEDSYTFIGSQNDRKDRFVLNLNYNAAGIDSESDIFAYQSGSDIIVSGEGELQVFDITGRKVMTTNINGVQTVNGMNNGVYIFRLNGKAQKIVVR